jgi:hypothetical protein
LEDDEPGIGDFPRVLERVLNKHILSDRSDFTVGDVNDLLDKLMKISNTRQQASNHDFRDNAPSRKKESVTDKRADWVRQLNPPQGKRGLCAKEHKWLIRILLADLKIGIGDDTILKWYNESAVVLFSSHNSLKAVCNTLCDPELTPLASKCVGGGGHGISYMIQPPAPITFGKPFFPMTSMRTGFQRCLSEISTRHRAWGKTREASLPLSLLHPAFSIETKLDGERLLVHIRRDGVVKMHTRHSNWYSDIYSPVLGPALRKAVGRYNNLDIVLDGEVLGWDSGREETIPFGNNRTIAKGRARWMEKHGHIDDRDKNIHNDDPEFKSMNQKNNWNNHDSTHPLDDGECWLEYQAFDVLYVDGPGAEEFLNDIVSPSAKPSSRSGSIIGLTAFERKKILYRLIDPQPHQVEIVDTQVVRPDGSESYRFFVI